VSELICMRDSFVRLKIRKRTKSLATFVTLPETGAVRRSTPVKVSRNKVQLILWLSATVSFVHLALNPILALEKVLHGLMGNQFPTSVQ
jgi:hypothetical protein